MSKAFTGWAGPDVADAAWDKHGSGFEVPPLFGSLPTAGARRYLWRYTRIVLGGKDIANIPQEIGDCTSWGGKHAIEYRACQEIAAGGDEEQFNLVFSPWLYGIARTVVGKGQINLNGDGAAGIWVAVAANKYGILAANAPNVPKYSGAVATSWGKNGPPREFYEFATPQSIQIARATSYEQVRDALATDCLVTVATQYIPQLGSVQRNGKHWMQLKWDANQGHMWTLIGVDDNGTDPGCYGLNSWGPDAHGKPLNGEPVGGAWMTADIVQKICDKRGEVIIWSGLKGWPSGVPNVVG